MIFSLPESDTGMDKKKRFIWSVLVFAGSVFYYTRYYNYGINLSDEGKFAYTSLRILDGQIPYIDFVSYPPALNYLMALVFRLFGINLLYDRLLWVFILSACVLMTLKLSEKLMGIPFRFFPPLLFLVVPGPWHKSIIPFLYLGASLLGYRYIGNSGRRSAFACGLLAGAAFYFRWDTSIFIFIAFSLLIAAVSFRNKPVTKGALKTWVLEEWSCFAGTALIALPAAAYLSYLQLRMGFFELVYGRVSVERKVMGFPFPRLDTATLASDPKVFIHNLIFYLPPPVLAGVFGILAFRYYRKRALDKEDLLVLLLLLLGLLTYNQTIVRTDYSHLLQSIHIPYILGMYLAWTAYRAARRVQGRWSAYALKGAVFSVAAACCAIYLSVNVSSSDYYNGTIGTVRNRTVPLGLARANVYLEPEEVKEVAGVVNFIQKNTSPEDPVLVLPYEPMFYFLSERRNPTYFDGVFPTTLADSGRKAAFMERVRESGVDLIVINDVRFTNDEKSRFSVYQADFMDYVKSNFRLATVIGNYQIYLKRNKG